MTGQAFTSAAAFYPLFSDDHARIEREGPLLERLLTDAPGTRVADIACGTGLHAGFFAGLGAKVDAFDLSPDMIAQAKRLHPHKHISYRTGDMTALSGGPYDLVVCLGNSLSLLADEKQVAQTFDAVAHCLLPEGRFLTQTLNYARPANRDPRQRIKCKMTGDTEVVAIKNLVPHHDRTLLSITYFAMSAGKTTTFSDTAVLSHLTPENLVRAAGRAGLHLEHLFGGYDSSPFDADTASDVIAVFAR